MGIRRSSILEAREALDRLSLLEPEAALEGRGAGGAGGARESQGGRAAEAVDMRPARRAGGRGPEMRAGAGVSWAAGLVASGDASAEQGVAGDGGGGLRAGSGERRAWW